MPNGESFRVLSKDRFAHEVMPVFFSSTSYKTFQRSLNLWGFRIFLKGPQRGECYHPCFQRGKPVLCERMTRVKLRGKYSKPKKHIQADTITTIKATVGKLLPLTSPTASDSEAHKEGRSECRVMEKRLMGTPTTSIQPLIPNSPSVLTMSPPYYYGINMNGTNNGNNHNGCSGIHHNHNHTNANYNHHNNIGPFLLQAAAETILQKQRETEIRRQLIQIMTANSSPTYPNMNHYQMMNQVVMSARNHGIDHQEKLLLPRTQFF